MLDFDHLVEYVPGLAQQIAIELDDHQIAPAVWQNYLQQQERAEEVIANCDCAKLAKSI